MAARILALYQHLAARVSWIDMRAAASSKNQVHLVAFIHQLYSGLRLNAYVAQQVMEHVADKIAELAAAESVRKGVASMHKYAPSSHIPALVQFLFEQVAFGTSAPECIDLATDDVWQMTNGRKYFPDPIAGEV